MRRSVTALALVVWVSLASADDMPGEVLLDASHGPVYVWTPPGYDASTAGLVIYVHGFYTTLPRAWEEHRLPEQFAASGLNAMFVACAAPRRPSDAVVWPTLQLLLDDVAAQVPSSLPHGRIAVIGHSGAHRTITRWLEADAPAQAIVLLDAFFGHATALRRWLAESDEHRLIDVAADTRPWTDRLHASLPETVVFRRFPSGKIRKLAGARRARIVYVRSQLDHMELVTEGVAIPIVLRALRLPSLTADRAVGVDPVLPSAR